MADGGLDLGKQVGPLPLGAWLAIVAGGLGLGYYINKQQGKGPEPQLLAEPGVGTGAGQLIYEPPKTAETPTVEQTNLTWGREATNWLISTGVNAYAADQAIRKYLLAEQLSIAEQAMVNLVLARFGAPPEPLPPAPVTPPPTPPPAPPPADVYAIKLTYWPKSSTRHKPWKLQGLLTVNGKPAPWRVVGIQAYRPAWGGWRFHQYVGTSSAGIFTYYHPGLGSNAWFRAYYGKWYTPRVLIYA